MIEGFVVKHRPALRREMSDWQECVMCRLALLCQEIQQPGGKKGPALPWSCWTCFHQHGKCSRIPKETDCRALMAKAPPAGAANLLPYTLPHRALSLLVLLSLSFPPSWSIFLSQFPHKHFATQKFRDRKMKERERSVERRQRCKGSVSSVPASVLCIF